LWWLLPSPILRTAHGERTPIRRRDRLFFGFRISLRSGEFFDDSGAHEIENLTMMAWGQRRSSLGATIKYLNS
jgi:hypothetical protein